MTQCLEAQGAQGGPTTGGLSVVGSAAPPADRVRWGALSVEAECGFPAPSAAANGWLSPVWCRPSRQTGCQCPVPPHDGRRGADAVGRRADGSRN